MKYHLLNSYGGAFCRTRLSTHVFASGVDTVEEFWQLAHSDRCKRCESALETVARKRERPKWQVRTFVQGIHIETAEHPTAPKVGDWLDCGAYEVEVIDIHVIDAEAWTADVECAG